VKLPDNMAISKCRMALLPSASYKSHYQQFTPPFEIPKSWQWVNITEVTSKITDGTHHSPENKPIGDFLYITAKNIKYDGIKKDSATYVNSNVHTEIYSRCNPEYGDILYIKDGATAGVVAINDLKVPFSLLSSVALIKPLGILNRYLYYFLRSDFSNSSIKKSMKGVGITRITLRQIEEWNIPVPPYAEQERIVKILDNYFSILSYLEWNIDTLQESIHNAKSKILDLAMQGKLVPQDPADEPAADIILRINPKAKIITDNPHYPQLPDNWVLTTVESVCNYGYSENVGVDNIESLDWVLELEDIEKDSGRIITKKVKQERAINGVRHRFAKDNVLYSKLRTYLNKVLVAPTDGYCTTEIIPVKSSDCVIPEYLCAWLRSPFFLSYTAECCYGVKMPRLSTTDARKGIIPLPPINEQKRIIQKLNEISTSLECLSNSLS